MEQSPYEIEGVNGRQGARRGPWGLLCLVLAVLLVLSLLWKRPPAESAGEFEGAPESGEPAVVAPSPTPALVSPPTPPPVVLREPIVPRVTRIQSGTDIQALSKDIDLKITLEASEGGLASVERKDRESYMAEYILKLRAPTAARTLAELSATNEALGEILPGLEAMVAEAKVSPWYGILYVNKAERMKRNLRRLDELLTRHNFYDCQSMINLVHPETKQAVFLLQAEMDVVSDGSDGDRLAEMPDDIVNSTHYQPFTSYAWPKRGVVPNPMVAGWRKRSENADRELSAAGTTDERKRWLKERKKYLERGIADMKSRSYLVADYDPFVVMPVNIITDRNDRFAPNVGDYVAVIHGKKIYPAIVGDGGPSFKVGEGSLRLAKEIEPRASSYSRPVSDLSVTYVVFPRSADSPWREPDYEHWRTRCGELLDKVGGLGEGYELHQWEDLFPKEEPVEEPVEETESVSEVAE